MKHLSGILALVVPIAVALSLCTSRGAAQAVISPLRIEATPVLGPGGAVSDGWLTIVVRIDNPSSSAIAGTLQVTSLLPWHNAWRFTTSAPFAVGGQSRVTLHLPTHGLGSMRAEYEVAALDSEGHELYKSQLPDVRTGEPVLFVLSMPSRLGAALEGRSVPTNSPPYNPMPAQLLVTNPIQNPATGDAILPDRAVGYSAATVVVAPSNALARLPHDEALALTDWVLGGGALAIVVTRPEDLALPLIRALIGGTIRAKPVPDALTRTAPFIVPDTATTPPIGHLVRRVSRPSSETIASLVGYSGGNLHDSRWGATATYGLGEVHLLAFDPLGSSAVREDEWTKLSLVDLVRHALDRRSIVAFPDGVRPLNDARLEQLQRLLDPNQSSRWTIAAAALLLLLYALMAGPWNFARAQRRGKPEHALLRLPLWSGSMLLAIVALGVVGKGVEGRSRRISLIESGAGMPVASVTRFRGLYSSRSDRLTVWTSEHDAVLDVAGEETDIERRLVVDRSGVRLEGLLARPWETVVVREDAYMTLGGGVSIARTPAGSWTISNRCARDLIGVVARADSSGLYYFARIKDGASVALTSGRRLTSSSALVTSSRTHPLDVAAFSTVIDADVNGLGAAWSAIETLADATDWWPADTPALIAQIDGGEGRLEDAGLRIDSDRTLLRVVGRGGVP